VQEFAQMDAMSSEAAPARVRCGHGAPHVLGAVGALVAGAGELLDGFDWIAADIGRYRLDNRNDGSRRVAASPLMAIGVILCGGDFLPPE
jgi:hypothetical protein